MHQVSANFKAKIATNTAGVGLGGVCHANGHSGSFNSVRSFESHHHDRARDNVFHKARIEWFAFMYGVVLLRQRALHSDEFHSRNAQPALLKAANDLSGQAAL